MTNANAQLLGFNGTANWYRHSLPGYTYTDGVQHLAATYKAYWFIDLVLSHQCSKQVRQYPFQIWELKWVTGCAYHITAGDGNGKQIAAEEISFSDFPFYTASLWLVDGIVMLPSFISPKDLL